MNIAIVGHFSRPVQKNTSYGIEMYIYHVICGLIEQGHEITLYAHPDSQVPCKIISPSITLNPETDSFFQTNHLQHYEEWLYAQAIKDAEEYDIIHCNNPARAAIFSSFTHKPVISILHEPWDTADTLSRCPTNLVSILSKQNKNHWIVTVSQYQKEAVQKTISQVEVIHNGIDETTYKPFYDKNNTYVAYLGRINQKKGIDKAIQACVQSNAQLKISGNMVYEAEKNYYEQSVLPYLNEKIEYIGETKSIEAKNELFGNAKLFLFPASQEEPFATTVLESQACGTPVIAFARGSIAEQIVDGQTGFIVNSSDSDIRGDWIIKKTGIEGLTEAIQRLYAIKDDEYQNMRIACRKRIEKNFTVNHMVKNYENLYKSILNKA